VTSLTALPAAQISITVSFEQTWYLFVYYYEVLNGIITSYGRRCQNQIHQNVTI